MRRIDSLSEKSIIVVGDFIIDQYLFGKCDRLSPEAPVPVFEGHESSLVLGGAGNVVNNISKAGASTFFVTNAGANVDFYEDELYIPEDCSVFNIDSERQTSVKTRFVADNHQLLRVDQEEVIKITKEMEDSAIEQISYIINKTPISAIIISDYGKGMITNGLCKRIIKLCRSNDIISLIDPKFDSFCSPSGCDFTVPNSKEAVELSYMVKNEAVSIGWERIAKGLTSVYGSNFVIKLGSEGVCYASQDGKEFYHEKSEKVDVFDVCGAGDTFIAWFACCLSCGYSLKTALKMANKAAGISVTKNGTATVSLNEFFNKGDK